MTTLACPHCGWGIAASAQQCPKCGGSLDVGHIVAARFPAFALAIGVIIFGGLALAVCAFSH